MKRDYKLFTDGGARGNPGPAAIGGVLFDERNGIRAQFSVYIGRATNNESEYRALLHGLQLAKKFRITHIRCFLDSELLVKQLNFVYKVKDKELARFFLDVHNLRTRFQSISFAHIPRERNQLADALVNKALDAHR